MSINSVQRTSEIIFNYNECIREISWYDLNANNKEKECAKKRQREMGEFTDKHE